MMSLEPIYSTQSYFWVQYGIVAQLMKDFENANNHLLYAKNIQPRSYAVKHALAKNTMERCLYSLSRSEEYDEMLFETGKEELVNLIESKYYSDAYLYSIHTYVDMILKYIKDSGKDMSIGEYAFIQSHLKSLNKHNLDTRMQSIINRFIEHCEGTGHQKYSNGLNKLSKITAAYVLDEEDYDADQVDIF